MPSSRLENFRGGLRADLRDMTKSVSGSYPLAFNVRTRNNTMVPVPGPVRVTSNAWSNVQGHKGMGKFHVVIADGYAWVKDSTTGAPYTRLSGYRLAANASKVYMEVVPMSTLTFARQLVDANKRGSVQLIDALPQLANGFYSDQGGGLPCMVVQDGSSQPMLIHPDASKGTFTCRKAKSYSEWTKDDPEYVPVGYAMLAVNNVLYIVGKSSRPHEDGRILFRSVTGRPLDFMVNIKQDGTAEPLEVDGGAHTVAHAFDYDRITALSLIPNEKSTFLACTDKQSFIIRPSRDITIFGEPTFPEDTYVGPVGAANENSVVSINGNMAVVSRAGIRLFNAVMQSQRESKNIPFSAHIQELLTTQSAPATIAYDDYILFAVNTVFGPAIVVYDTVPTDSAPNGRYVSIDINPGWNSRQPFGASTASSDPVIQFAITQDVLSNYVYALTSSGEVYQLFAGTTYNAGVYLGDFYVGAMDKSVQPSTLMLTALYVPDNTTFSVTHVVDGRQSNTYSKPMLAGALEKPPMSAADLPLYRYLGFNIHNKGRGTVSAFYISWTTSAELSAIDVDYDIIDCGPLQEKYS